MVLRTKLSLKARLVATVALTVSGVICVIAGILSYQIYRDELEEVNKITTEMTWRYANLLRVELETDLENAKTMAYVLESAQQGGFGLSRYRVNLILKHFIEKNPNLLRISAMFDSNTFDGRDHNFVNEAGHDASGRFMVAWTRDPKGRGSLEYLGKHHTNDYLETFGRKRRETITEPYISTLHGEKLLLTSVAAPIRNQQAQFIGAILIERDFSHLQQLAREADFSLFDKSYVTLFSAGGIVVAGSDPDEYGLTIEETTDNADYVNAVLSGHAFVLKRTAKNNSDILTSYGMPVEIGETGNKWIVVVHIPQQALLDDIYEFLGIIGSVALGGILIVTLLLYALLSRLVFHIAGLNRQLSMLATGNPQKISLTYDKDDELGGLFRAGRQLQHNMRITIEQANAIAQGNYDVKIELQSDTDQLGRALLRMTEALRQATERNALQDWVKSGEAGLARTMSGEQNPVVLAEKVITFLTEYLEAQIGLFYAYLEKSTRIPEPHLKLLASYAFEQRKNLANEFLPGEGIAGQAALEKKTILLTEAPADYAHVHSGLGYTAPTNIAAFPFMYENELKGIIEIATIKPFSKVQLEFIRQVTPAISVALNMAESREQIASMGG